MGTTLATNQEQQPRPDRFEVGQVWRKRDGDPESWLQVSCLTTDGECRMIGGFLSGENWQFWPMPKGWSYYGIRGFDGCTMEQYEVLPE